MHRVRAISILTALSLMVPAISMAQVPAPGDVFGFEPGSDYKLADYNQLTDFYGRLDAASARVQMREIGRSVLDRPLFLMMISSEQNLRDLDRWREMAEKLARGRVSEEEARRLAGEGKAIVWIDAGLHATERATAQMVPLLAHHLATSEDPEAQKIRDQVVLLLMPVMNPDGLDIVVDWYRKNLGSPFETTRPPWLYHHYVGHDNNRDWFMNNMPESAAVTRVLYSEWYPQIVYNHHQTGPAWARIFLPPFADPVNPKIPAGVTTGVNLVGTAMANRFAIKNMPGVVSDMIYSMWWNGGMRTVPYFHNMIGILTETSHSTPTPRFYDPEKRPRFVGRPRRGGAAPTSGTDIFYPNPWKGGESHFRDAVDYTFTASMGVLDIAADRRERWLLNIYSMARDSIEAGAEGPYAYVVSPDQWDRREAVELVRTLEIGGVEIHRADSAFTAGDRSFPKDSYVILAAQAFRPYLMDLLEKQDYPDRRRTPGGDPEPPYDLAGWTLPMQMGVDVARVEKPFRASLSLVENEIPPASGSVSGSGTGGYLMSARKNATFKALNRLLKDGAEIKQALEPVRVGGSTHPAGSFVLESGVSRETLNGLSREIGIEVVGLGSAPSVRMRPVKAVRVGLYKSWVANMDEGWTRWLLEQYDFPLETLTDQDIRSKNLSGFDSIILPSQNASSILNGHAPNTMPADYVGGIGLEGSLALKRYVENGGTLVTLDQASDFAIDQFGLPLRNVVSDTTSRQFFIPGSLIRVDVDLDHPIAFGTQEMVAASFVRSRAFDVRELSRRGEGGVENTEPAPPQDIEVIARYAKDDLLMSGWELGAKRYIGGKSAVVRARLGQGHVVLFGFRPQFRGQPRGTYKLFFNALHSSAHPPHPQAPAASD